MSIGRLEMVVKGQRQTALSTAPRLAVLAPPGKRLSTGRTPEAYVRDAESLDSELSRRIDDRSSTCKAVPFRSRQGARDSPRKRVLRRVSAVRNEEIPVRGQRPGIILSIEPEVLMSMISGPQGSNASELAQRWHGMDPILRDILMSLRSEIEGSLPTGPLCTEHLYAKLTEQLIQRYPIGKIKLNQYKGGLPGPKLKQVIGYIESNLDLKLTTGEIARIACLSKYHLGKAFSTSTGMTLHSFVLARRIRKAREFLANSDLPLADIADAVGFSNQSHFTTVFLERTGLTPGRFRSIRRSLSVSFSR